MIKTPPLDHIAKLQSHQPLFLNVCVDPSVRYARGLDETITTFQFVELECV